MSHSTDELLHAPHKRLNARQRQEQEKKRRKLLSALKDKSSPARFLTQSDEEFDQVMRTSYRGLEYYSAARFTAEFNASPLARYVASPSMSSSSSAQSSSSSAARSAADAAATVSVEPVSPVPPIPAGENVDIHSMLQKDCFLHLLHEGLFFRDVIQVAGNDAGGLTGGVAEDGSSNSVPRRRYHYVRTRVQRCLVGERGMTYRYSGIRLFAHPWIEVKTAADDDGEKNQMEPPKPGRQFDTAPITYPSHLIQSFRLLHILNSHLRSTAERALKQTFSSSDTAADPDPEVVRGPDPAGADWNLTLLNFLDPRSHSQPLRPEPYYKMGYLAVGWHRDESLEPLSSIGVYHSSEELDTARREKTKEEFWHVALKRAWDIDTPAIKLALHSGDAYFMLYELNTTHQHAVLAGTGKRFSSTHRKAVMDKNTLDYIFGRIHAVRQEWDQMVAAADDNQLSNLTTSATVTPESIAIASSAARRILLPHVELLLSVWNELEFEWIRMFWIQGTRHARMHAYYWLNHVNQLEVEWRRMQRLIAWTYHALANYYFSQPQQSSANASTAELTEQKDDSSFSTSSTSSTASQVVSATPATSPSSTPRDVAICDLLLSSFRSASALRRQWSSRYKQDAYHPTKERREKDASAHRTHDHAAAASGPSESSSFSSQQTYFDGDDDGDDGAPVIRPHFSEEDESTLPFNLSHHIAHLQEWLVEFQQLAQSNAR